MMYMNARAFPEIMIKGSYMIAKIEIHQLIDIIFFITDYNPVFLTDVSS